MPSFLTHQPDTSVDDKILAMTEYEIRTELPDKLRATGLFREDEIDHAIEVLLQFRAQHQIEDIIE